MISDPRRGDSEAIWYPHTPSTEGHCKIILPGAPRCEKGAELTHLVQLPIVDEGLPTRYLLVEPAELFLGVLPGLLLVSVRHPS